MRRRGEGDLKHIFQQTESLSHKAKYCFVHHCTMKEQCLPKVLVMEVVFLKLEKGTSVDKREGRPNRQRVLWVTLSNPQFSARRHNHCV